MKESTGINFLKLEINKSALSNISDNFTDFIFQNKDGKKTVLISYDKKDLKQIVHNLPNITYKKISNPYSLCSYMLDYKDIEGVKKNKDLINIYDKTETSSLFDVVVATGDIKYVKEIIELFDIDLSKIDTKHLSPVITAIKKGDLEYYNAIKDLGFSVTEESDGETPLLVSYTMGKLDIFNTLYGDYTPKPTEKNGEDLIHFASMLNDKKIVMNLIMEHKVDVNLQNKLGQTPLFYAIVSKNIEMVQTLIKHGANAKIKDNNGQSSRDLMRTVDKKLFKKLIKETRNQ